VSNLPGAEVAPLPQRLRDLQRRSRAVLGNDLIRHPDAAPLHSLGRALLQNERLILSAWRSRAGNSDCSRDAAIENLVVHSHGLLDAIVQQIALCDSTARQALAGLEIARRLMALEPVRYVEVLPLCRRVFDEAGPAGALDRLVPPPGLALASLVASRAGFEAGLFVEGLTAARLLGWLLHDDRRAAERLPALVLAALLQDVGRLSSATSTAARRRRDEKRGEWLERHHPAVGAALLETIAGAPVELVLVAGQHHERLDGGGYPRALTARDILPDSATLAAATRFARLVLGLDSATASSGGAGNTPGSVAEILLAEARWGYWPVEFAGRVAGRIAAAAENSTTRSAISPQAPAQDEAVRADVVPVVSRDDDSHRRLDGREEGLPGTHAAIGGRFPSSGWYAKKMLIDPRRG
jgi:hypothetical protein